MLLQMRSLLLALFLSGAFVASYGADEPKIRAFDIKTIESLGKELYQRDLLAAKGGDLLFEKRPEARTVPLRGWITEITKDVSNVYMIQETDAGLSLAYVVAFPEKGEPSVEDKRGAEIPKAILTRYQARKTGIAAIHKFFKRTYNFEVLDDPDGSGFLVYALASTTDANEIVVGGHFRVSVSANGEKAKQVDALSNSLLILQKAPRDQPKDSKTVGYAMSHLVSSTPVETHVFVSLANDIPLFVATPDKIVWKVESGSIKKVKAK